MDPLSLLAGAGAPLRALATTFRARRASTIGRYAAGAGAPCLTSSTDGPADVWAVRLPRPARPARVVFLLMLSASPVFPREAAAVSHRSTTLPTPMVAIYYCCVSASGWCNAVVMSRPFFKTSTRELDAILSQRPDRGPLRAPAVVAPTNQARRARRLNGPPAVTPVGGPFSLIAVPFQRQGNRSTACQNAAADGEHSH